MKLFPQIYGDLGGKFPFHIWPCLGWCSYTVMSPEGDGRLLPSGILWSHGGLSGRDQTLDWWMPLGWSMLRLTGKSGIHLICRFKDVKFRTKVSIGFIGFCGDLYLFLNVFFLKENDMEQLVILFCHSLIASFQVWDRGVKEKETSPNSKTWVFFGTIPCPHRECENSHEV